MDLLEPAPSSKAGEYRLVITQDLASPNIDDFEEAFNGIECPEGDQVILDFDQVERVDSSGIGLLYMLLKRLRESNTKLVLLRPRPLVRNVFKITAMDQLTEVRDA